MIGFINRTWSYLLKKGYTQFFIVGVLGVSVQLFVTWFFTYFVFGLERYFMGYLIGLFVTLLFNFILHTFFTFKTKSNHGKRFFLFVLDYVAMIFIQAFMVRYFTAFFGVQYYLLVIAGIIFALSNLNFLFFKFFIFKNTTTENI